MKVGVGNTAWSVQVVVDAAAVYFDVVMSVPLSHQE
jgi:hypothetical protein